MIGRVVNFFGDAAHAKARRRLLWATLVVVFAADFLVNRDHGDFFWDFIPGWGGGVRLRLLHRHHFRQQAARPTGADHAGRGLL